jgi:hypothetical protein
MNIPFLASTENPVPVKSELAPGAQLTAFGELRVAEPNQIVNGIHDFDARPDLYAQKPAAGSEPAGMAVAFQPNERCVLVTLTQPSLTLIRQTYLSIPYRAGLSSKWLSTIVPMDLSGDVIYRFGYFNGKDGLFFEIQGPVIEGHPSVRAIQRSYVSGTAVDTIKERVGRGGADPWDDPLDGTGPSGIDMANRWNKNHIGGGDLQWLGNGMTRFGMDLSGILVPVVTFDNASNLDSVYMGSASLPLRVEIETTAGFSGTARMKHICGTVIREGNDTEAGNQRVATMGTTTTAVTATAQAIVGVRVNELRIGGLVAVLSAEVSNLDTGDLYWTLQVGPTYTGAPSWNDVPQSNAEQAVGPFPVTADGVVIAEGRVSGGTSQGRVNISGGVGGVNLTSATALGADVDGVPQEAWLVVQRLGGTNTVASGHIDILDVR